MILEELAKYSEYRVEQAKKLRTIDDIKREAYSLPKGKGRFKAALGRDGVSFICEVKKASPSKGIIDAEFDYLNIAHDYERAGADCISCLTEPKWFLGSDRIFREIRESVNLPMLRKDFTVDEYQIYEARCMGADAVLLICSILSADTLFEYLGICRALGLDALVETHNAEEIKTAIAAGAEIIGVNNRNLKDFSMNLGNAVELGKIIPEEIIFVAESGIRTAEDVKRMRDGGADAVLVGETLMRAADKTAALAELKGEL